MTNHRKLSWCHCVTEPQMPFFHKRKGILKIDRSVKKEWQRISLGFVFSYSSAPDLDRTKRAWNSCYYSWACRQSFFCLRLHSGEAYGSIQWKMTHEPRLHVKTSGNCNSSHYSLISLVTIWLPLRYWTTQSLSVNHKYYTFRGS